MEQEKIKAIKQTVRYLVDTYGTNKCIGKPNKKLFHDILTLINELESENERLQRDYVVKAYDELRAENKKLKNRIAKLEKELTNDRVFYKEGICYPMNCQGALKQFAERLKDKLKARHEINRLLLMPVRDVVLSTIEGLREDVYETLKEFINE